MGSPRHAADPPRAQAAPTRRVLLAAIVSGAVLLSGVTVVAAQAASRGDGSRASETASPPRPSSPAPSSSSAPGPTLAPVGVDWVADAQIKAAVVGQRLARQAARASARRSARTAAPAQAVTRAVAPTVLGAAPPGGDVWVVGDSIAAGMGQQWPGAPAVVADPGARSGLVVTQVAPALAAAPGRPLVVVALGTNDDPRQVEAFRADVRALLGSAPGCVVWATVHRPGGRWEPLNAVLRGESARSGGRLQLADWDAFATANPQVLQADGIHPRTGTVYRSLVGLASAAAARCR